MDALDYAYEWLEESAAERKQKNLDEDSALLAAFVAGYEAAQQSVQATLLDDEQIFKMPEPRVVARGRIIWDDPQSA
jgi:hypothetical protein